VTRGAVYGHFKNKSDVFAALCERVRLPTETICQTNFTTCKTAPLARLRESWIFVLRQTATNPNWRRVLEIIFHRCEIIEENGLIRQRMHQAHLEGTGHMAELLRQAATQGELPADLDIDAAMPLLHGALVGVLNDWLFRPEAFDLEAQAERFLDALIDMLRTSPALRKTKPG
jgi:TetR/AcrR family acrAB operon transcriptional repressor